MKTIKIVSTMAVKELNKQLEQCYAVTTPQGNIAGDNRNLRAMTDKDISSPFTFSVDLFYDGEDVCWKDDDYVINEFKKATGISIKPIHDLAHQWEEKYGK